MKHLKQLGEVLSKTEQKSINGGIINCPDGITYGDCDPNPNAPRDPCVICVNLWP